MANAEVRTPLRSESEVVADVVAQLLRIGAIPYTAKALAAACRAAAVPAALVRERYERMGRNGYSYEAPVGTHDLRLVAPADEVSAAKVEALEAEVTMLRSSITAARITAAEAERDEALAETERLRLALERMNGAKRPPARTPEQATTQQKATATRKARAGNEKLVDGVVMRRCSRDGGHWLPADPDHFYVKNPDTGALSSMCHEHRREYQRARYFTVSKQAALNTIGVELLIGADDDVHGLTCTECKRPLVIGDRVAGHSSLHHVECPEPDAPVELRIV